MNTYPEQDCFRRDVPKDAAEILANDILKEQATRINEDALIRVSIADEVTARAQRDAQLELWFNTEEADRISADNALSVQIGDEVTDRSDADMLLTAAISAEEAARIAADTSLGDAIVDEEDARIAADNALDARLDAIEPSAMTEAEKTKLAGIAAGAEVNVNADWNSVGGDSQILNKPDIPDSMFDFSDHSRFIFGDNAYGSTLVTNLNTIEKTGTYTALAGATGAPDATHAFGVQHSNSTQNANIAFQQAVAVDANMVTYERIKLSGTWSAWIRTWNAKDVPGFSATPSAGKAMVWPGAYYPWTPVDNTSRVAEYTGDGGGATVKDRAGNGNNLTATNITYVNGRHGKEMSFNGSTSYAQASSPVIGTTGTVAVRFKINASTLGDIATNTSNSVLNGFRLRVAAGGSLNAFIAGSSTQQNISLGTFGLISYNTIVISWDGTTVTKTVAGVTTTEAQTVTMESALFNLTLGNRPEGGTYFNGIISHFRYDSRIWTADEARAWSLNPISIDSRVA